MILTSRIALMVRLGEYMLSDEPEWLRAQEEASHRNPWFTPEFLQLAIRQAGRNFLAEELLTKWVASYSLDRTREQSRRVGIVMAGNVPLVGFHDFLCGWIAGHQLLIKPSSRDEILIRHLVSQLGQWEPAFAESVQFSDMLKGCEAYIATGSNNTAGYFDYYFRKYPHIIRRNRTSVAILSGNETAEELSLLADDVYQYFGLGCRNVTQLYLPPQYDFVPLLRAFDKYNYLADYHKYKNNYDYNLAILILNKKAYMSNPSLLLVEDASPFSPIGQLHYSLYTDDAALRSGLQTNMDIQCVVGQNALPFGHAQQPGLSDYADGVDTMKFLASL